MVSLDEARFREITASLDAQFKNLVETALAAMSIREPEIGQVVLVGGGSQLFSILGYLRERFGPQSVILADNPEEIVIQGIGLEYGSSVRETGPVTILPPEPPREKETPEIVPPPAENAWTLKSADGTSHPLSKAVTTIGRGEGNDLQIDALKVSRLHAELRLNAGRLEAVDLGSTNGTFVNGERLAPQQPRMLNPGDEVSFGATKFACAK
jgi:hypothetical protein